MKIENELAQRHEKQKHNKYIFDVTRYVEQCKASGPKTKKQCKANLRQADREGPSIF